MRWGRQRGQVHPEHAVKLPSRIVTVVYDGTLYRQLLEIYIVDGWGGIRAVQGALQDASRSRRAAALHPWGVAKSFFTYTRNLLILSIREALMSIERKAADRLVLELSLSARLVNESWRQLDVRPSSNMGEEGGRTYVRAVAILGHAAAFRTHLVYLWQCPARSNTVRTNQRRCRSEG